MGFVKRHPVGCLLALVCVLLVLVIFEIFFHIIVHILIEICPLSLVHIFVIYLILKFQDIRKFPALCSKINCLLKVVCIQFILYLDIISVRLIIFIYSFLNKVRIVSVF